MIDTRVYWLALNSIKGIGGITARILLERFGAIEAIFQASAEALRAIPRINARIIKELHDISIETMESELVALANEGIDVLTWDDPIYPSALKILRDAPPVLFTRGKLLPPDAQAVAIVGTRQPSGLGIQRARTLGWELAARGWTIVSGLAVGIDTVAHLSALEAQGGRTLAVLGSGLRIIHPRSNEELAELIVDRGALLSELPPDTPPRGPQLMARDRIIAGLTQAVIVVEAGEKSGSLDTATRARKLERPVFALGGSPGTELLLAEGAKRLEWETLDCDELVQEIAQAQPQQAHSYD